MTGSGSTTGDAAASAVAGFATHQGRVRDHNEDSLLVRPPVYAVADGMGGHAAGEVASRLAIESLAQSASLVNEAGEEGLRQALSRANQVVFDEAQGLSHGMGTTCAVLVLDRDKALVGNVGDSRIYRLRNNALDQLTRDHTVVAEMVEQGLIQPGDAMVDDRRGYLARALGGAQTVEVDVATVDVMPGDRFVLCSDGLTTMVDDAAIRQIADAVVDPQQAADLLVAAANEAGGQDNVTVVVVDPETRAGPARGRGRPGLLAAGIVIVVVVVVAAIALALAGGSLFAPEPTPRRHSDGFIQRSDVLIFERTVTGA